MNEISHSLCTCIQENSLQVAYKINIVMMALTQMYVVLELHMVL